MLVYANHLNFKNKGAEEAIYRAVGAWLKEQLGYGLHPSQLKQKHDFEGENQSRLKIEVASSEDVELFLSTLITMDTAVYGRRWVTEIGLKKFQGEFELSCILKTDEKSTMVDSVVSVSRPRFIRYVVNNIRQSKSADFCTSVPGVNLKKVGKDIDSFRALRAEIEREGRKSPIVLISPTRQGEYLLDAEKLQQDLIGLAQVVSVESNFNRYDMKEVLGGNWSAWDGAFNVLHTPSVSGLIRGRFFKLAEIEQWGTSEHARMSQLLAWVTNNTNLSRQRKRIRPEGIRQLALIERLKATRVGMQSMDKAQLEKALEDMTLYANEQADFIDELVEENSRLESQLAESRISNDGLNSELKEINYRFSALRSQITSGGKGGTSLPDVEKLIELVISKSGPRPLECLEVLESIYGDRCVILNSAKSSAEQHHKFEKGHILLDLLKRLVNEYRQALIDGGDNAAKDVFGKNEYAAKESKTTRGNKAASQARKFEYDGKDIEMLRHLKIGTSADESETSRTHFHWDHKTQKIIIGYCGKHLPLPGR